LLGEPGIGKSVAMAAERSNIEAKVKEEGGQLLWLDLRSHGSEDRLIGALFRSKEFVSWLSGRHELHIYLDSLDECLLRIEQLGSLLVDELTRYPVDRLRFRVACRTADWPNVLETGLRKLWPDGTFKAYELSPLRRVDVKVAATANGLDAEAFLQEIDRKEVVPLAIKPVTLRFLLNTYKNTGGVRSMACSTKLERKTSGSKQQLGRSGTPVLRELTDLMIWQTAPYANDVILSTAIRTISTGSTIMTIGCHF
jgi:predicted NACHT family NTPase